ncbi:EFR1 family ferrodoxin [Candidatus Lokiarchaeum ossiferum]|uniref:EFR1 family ferrodoxin n=1 Tax=Candidatus Lokiarchaeum ossiferum TaxID=2951803 RepID=UPI00352D0963
MIKSTLKIGLFYYSGTGATAYFAQKIAESMQNNGHTVTLIRYRSQNHTDFDEYDLIGFGAAVWVWRSPRVFTNFLKNIKLNNKPYFIFQTCGGTPGNAQWSIYKALKHNNGIYLGDTVGTGANNIRSWRANLSEPEDTKNLVNPADIEKAKAFATKMCSQLTSTETEEWPKFASIPPQKYFKWSVLGTVSSYRWQMQMLVGKKKLIQDKCTKCGLCANKICPSGAITLNSDKHPEFNEKLCQGCQGCINLCPTLAIETKSSRTKQPFVTYRKEITNL